MRFGENCGERKDLFALAHGLLKGREEGALRRHVEGCDRCRAMLDECVRLDAVLEAWRPVEPSAWFDAQVQAALAAAKPARRPARLLGLDLTRWLAPTLATVVVLAAATFLVRTRLNQRRPRVSQPSGAATVSSTKSSSAVPRTAEQELKLYKNLPVLENYDVLAGADVLSELPKGSDDTSD